MTSYRSVSVTGPYSPMVLSLGFGAEPQDESCERSELLFRPRGAPGRSERSERRVGAAVGGREAVFFACSGFRVRSRTEEIRNK